MEVGGGGRWYRFRWNAAEAFTLLYIINIIHDDDDDDEDEGNHTSYFYLLMHTHIPSASQTPRESVYYLPERSATKNTFIINHAFRKCVVVIFSPFLSLSPSRFYWDESIS